MTEQITVTVRQACKMTGISRSTIYTLFETGRLQKRKLGGRTLIMVSDLRALMDSLSDTANEAA